MRHSRACKAHLEISERDAARGPKRHAITIAGVVLLLAPILLSGNAAGQEGQAPTIRTTTSEVLLDFVVRDKHANIIRDLRPEEIQVFEDGAPQTLRHFEFLDGHAELKPSPEPAPTAPATAAMPSAKGPVEPMTVNEVRTMSVVSVVIGNLDPRGRELTLNAMREFAKTDLGPNTYVGVFTLGMGGLRNVQSYTNDASKVSAAVERAVSNALSGQFTAIDSGALGFGGLGSVSMAVETPQFASSGSNGGGATAAEANRSTGALWVNEMHDVYIGSMEYLSPLRSLVEAQAPITGRKIMLLFSPGILVHPDTVELLQSIISAANRANVSIYAVDTQGQPDRGKAEYSSPPSGPALSEFGDANRRLQEAATASKNMQLSTIDKGSAEVTPDQVIAMEIAETSIHSDTRGNMAELAEGTGGALLPDTIDLREPIREAIESSRTHYEVTYAPSNTAIDGNFRRIEVKLTRPGATVFARNGYYAVPLVNGHQVYPFEIATLKAISTKPDLHQFDFNTTTLEFRSGEVRNQYAFIFQAPTKDLTVTTDEKWAKVHVCVTALIKDSKGQVVDKISKDIPYDLPLAKKEEMEKGIVSFTAPFFLAPGHYTLDVASVDRNSMKASVNRSTLDVDQDSGFSISDVAVVRSLDDIHGDANPYDPFESRGGDVTPQLGDPIWPDASGNLRFYAAAYPPMPVDQPVAMKVEIYQDDNLVAQSPVYAVSPDANGAATAIASISTAKLQPGQYEANVIFQYKSEKLTKRMNFTLAGGGVANN